MATSYRAGQYEDAFAARNLQNWTLPRLPCAQLACAREGHTQFITDDRGHLLPTVPRSKASPWGTFMGTWDMPLKIPPVKLNLTSRSVAAASRLTDWVYKSKALTSACNGLLPEITGKPQELESHQEAAKETSNKNSRASNRDLQLHRPSAKMPPEEEEDSYKEATTPKIPLSRQPGSMDVRLSGATSPAVPASHQPASKEAKHRGAPRPKVPLSRQPGCMDVRLKEAITPKVQVSGRTTSRETNPRRTISAEVSAPSLPGSMEARPKGVSSPNLMASSRPGSMEANFRGATSPDALALGRPGSKASRTSETWMRMLEGGREEQERVTQEGRVSKTQTLL